jgi:hypothetical protein
MVATAVYVQEEMLVRDGGRPSWWRNHLPERARKVVAKGASGVPGTGLFAETDCAAAIMVSEGLWSISVYLYICISVYLYIDTIPSTGSGEPTHETHNCPAICAQYLSFLPVTITIVVPY